MVGFFGVGLDDVGVGRLISAEPGWRGKSVFVLGCVCVCVCIGWVVVFVGGDELMALCRFVGWSVDIVGR